MPFKVYVVWGETLMSDDKIHDYEFATEAEREAFILGVEESNGWLDYFLSIDQAEAEAHLKERLEEEEQG